jgi:hypothetical protein
MKPFGYTKFILKNIFCHPQTLHIQSDRRSQIRTAGSFIAQTAPGAAPAIIDISIFLFSSGKSLILFK